MTGTGSSEGLTPLSDGKAEEHMLRCLDRAREAVHTNNYPLASMVVFNGSIVSEATSSLLSGVDPTAHPEMQAIRLACERIGSRYLPDAILVSTLEPCPMCTAAAMWAKFGGIVFGACQEDAIEWRKEHPSAPVKWTQIKMKSEQVVAAGERDIWVKGGVLRAECSQLFDLSLSLKKA